MARLRSIRRLFPRLVQVGHKRRALLAEAVLSLLAARATLIFVSFPQLARRLGAMVPPADARVGKAAVLDNYEQAFIAREVGWSVTRAACFMPFKAVCLQQAMAARSMLRRRGVPSVLILAPPEGKQSLSMRTPGSTLRAWRSPAIRLRRVLPKSPVLFNRSVFASRGQCERNFPFV
jgi:hypothetical protein